MLEEDYVRSARMAVAGMAGEKRDFVVVHSTGRPHFMVPRNSLGLAVEFVGTMAPPPADFLCAACHFADPFTTCESSGTVPYGANLL
jgi:hypothetical protein